MKNVIREYDRLHGSNSTFQVVDTPDTLVERGYSILRISFTVLHL